MNFINSQYITEKLTHLTPHEGYDGMRKNGIKVTDRGSDSLLYKPPGFWISVNGDWERWCESENFRDVKNETICDVYLKSNLLFIKISTVEDSDELIRFLLPDMPDYNPGFRFNISDLINFSHYEFERLKKGFHITAREVWRNAMNSCDGIYYVNSCALHFQTIFNTWDCDSIMLFDPRNILSIIKN